MDILEARVNVMDSVLQTLIDTVLRLEKELYDLRTKN